MSEEAKASLYAKMAKVMGATQRLPKRGRNEYFKYDFVQDADVLEAVRDAMAEVNMALFVSLEGYQQEDSKTLADFALTFADGDTGAIHAVKWAAEAQDKGDKGLNKAATAAVKYCLLKTFLIPTGDDDPDAEGGGSVERKSHPRQRKQAAKPKPKGGDGKEPDDQPPNAALLARWEELVAEGKALGLEVLGIELTSNDEADKLEITRRGKMLKAEIAAAKAEAEGKEE